MLDVSDQWPMIFTDPLPGPLRPLLGRPALASRLLLDEACAMRAPSRRWHPTFCKWSAGAAWRESRKWTDGHATDATHGLSLAHDALAEADQCMRKGWSLDGRRRICQQRYHSPAFDIEPVYLAAKAMADGAVVCEFVLCGDCANTPAWKSRPMGLANVRFPG